MPKITYQLSLHIPGSAVGAVEILRNLLKNLRIRENQIVELEEGGQRFLRVYFFDQAKALSLKRKIQRLDLHRIEIYLKSIHNKDWQNRWKEDFKPFALTKTFQVIPMEMRKEYRTHKKPIYIEPGLAFGTGLHATTRFMVELIENCQGRFQNFLDIGTGTGILAIAAAKCGAHAVDAIDLKRDVIAVARKNFKVNRCCPRSLRAVNFQKFKTRSQYDFVAANLATEDLIDFRKKIPKIIKKGKYLAVSGISMQNYLHFRKAFQSLPLKCLSVKKEECWVAVLYKKNGG